MSEISPLTEQDVCDIVRLLGEVAAMKPDANAQRIYLMEELAGLLGTDTWVWGVALLLHEVGIPHANSRTLPQFPPQCRLVMNHIVRGQMRKRIADHLGLSG